MDSRANLHLKRAFTEIQEAEVLFRISGDAGKKREFQLEENTTFYSGVIGHAYYSIFYAAKAILLTKGITTTMPNIHKKTYESFKKAFVDTGILDITLLNAYRKMIIRADELLQIFKDEKWKRGHFTYETMPQANIMPAKESVDHALKFTKHIAEILEK